MKTAEIKCLQCQKVFTATFEQEYDVRCECGLRTPCLEYFVGRGYIGHRLTSDKPVNLMNEAERIVELDSTLQNWPNFVSGVFSEDYRTATAARKRTDRAYSLMRAVPTNVVKAFKKEYGALRLIDWVA